jgi:hypothetical protein
MAINIDIPGVGRVQVEGVASEAVMEKILAQLKAMDPKSSSSPAAAANKQAAEAAKKFEEALKNATTEEEKAMLLAAKDAAEKRNSMERMKSTVRDFTTNVAANTTRLAASLVKMHDSIAADPISAGASLLNVGIDMTSRAAKTTSGALLDLGSEIPIVGGLFKGLKGAAEGAIEALSAAAKIANDVLAKELAKTAESMKNFATMGASFAGGLTELRNISGASGLNLQAFTNVVKNSRESILAMGLTMGEAAGAIGKSMQTASVMTGRSGKTLRDEMLSMGIGYEEQGVIMSQYMSQMKASGQLEKMSREEIAQGTRDYARDLKVLADITGQDAKKLQERARVESMRGALEGKMSADQQKAFKDAYSTLMTLGPEAGPKLQAALTQMLAGGTVTDPVIAGNAQAMAIIRQTAAGVQAGNQNMIAQTQAAVASAAADYRQVGETATDTAVAFGVNSPTVQGFAQFGNALRAYKLDPGAAAASNKAAEGMASTQDDATKGFVKATDAAMKFSVAVENIATKALPKYSDMLGTALQGMVEAFRKVGIDIPKTEAEIAAEKKAAAENAAAAEKGSRGVIDLGGGVEVEGQNVAAAGGAVLSGPESGYKPNLTMHGTEAIVPLENNKIPIQFESDWYDKLSKAAMLITGTTRNSMADGINTSGDFGKAMVDYVNSATTKIRELEQSEAGRAQVNEIMKGFGETLLQLKEGRSRVESGQVAMAGEGTAPMIDAQNRMIALFEQFLTKQDEAKAELERARVAQEMMRDLM